YPWSGNSRFSSVGKCASDRCHRLYRCRKGAFQVSLSSDDLRKLYELMLLTRRIDERMWALNRQGKVAAMASCQGQEAAQVGSVSALEPQDYIAVAYREHGVAVARGMPPRDIMAFALGRAADPNTRARQIPGHYSSHALNILSSSSPVGTQIPHAV